MNKNRIKEEKGNGMEWNKTMQREGKAADK